MGHKAGDPGLPAWADGVDSSIASMDSNIATLQSGKLDASTASVTYRSSVNVKSFGATGDGSTDDTAAIQAAINYAKTLVRNASTTKQQDGAVIYFPKGLYLISATLLINESNITLEGESWSSSVIYAPAATFDLVKFDNATAALYNCGIRKLRFSTPGNTTAGFHLKVMHAIYFVAEDLEFNGWYGGLYIGGCAKMFSSRLIFSQEVRSPATSTTAAAVDMSCDYTYSSDVHFTDVQIMEDINYAGVNSFIVRGVDGLYLENVHMHGSFLVNPSNTGNEVVISSIVASNMYFDSSRDVCAILSGTAASAYKDVRFTNCYFRAGVVGLRLATTTVVKDIKITGSTFAQNSLNGFEITNHNVNGLTLADVTFDGNNTGNSASYGDMKLNGNAVSVDGAHFYGGGAAGFGVNVDAASSYVMLSGLDFINSAAGTKVINSGGYTVFKGAVGWNAKVRGSVAVGSGVTSVTVTHGCSLTPALESIRLTPGASCPAMWVDTITATTFLVHFASATAAAFTLGYGVDMEF